MFVLAVALPMLLIGLLLIDRASTRTFYVFLALMLLFGLMEKFGMFNLVH
jgi:hypothetical protein